MIRIFAQGAAVALALMAGGVALANVLPNTKPDASGIVFANVSIAVSDLDKSAAFYKALGFEVGAKSLIPGPLLTHALGSKDAARMEMLFVRRDGMVLELIQLTPLPKPVAIGGPGEHLGLAHIAFRVDDVDRIAGIVKENGGKVVDATRAKVGSPGPGQGIDVLFCTDPDGTLMEISAPLK